MTINEQSRIDTLMTMGGVHRFGQIHPPSALRLPLGDKWAGYTCGSTPDKSGFLIG